MSVHVDIQNPMLREFESQLHSFSLSVLGGLEDGLGDVQANYRGGLEDGLGDVQANYRSKRSSCPGGVGNLGFNSFNFMTFMLLTMNAVANTNNNINNNNNNNINLNYNSISQDSNNVISNSENMNTIMAIILPVPGRRSFPALDRMKRSSYARTINSTLLDHRLSDMELDLIPAEMMRDLISLVQWIVAGQGQCEGWRVCKSIKYFSERYLKDAMNTELLEHNLSPLLSKTNCCQLFPSCGSIKN